MLFLYGGPLRLGGEIRMEDAELNELLNSSEPVDLRGIAALLGVSRHTPNQWRQRDLLPKTDFPKLLRPAWKTSTIIRWAVDTGRWPPGEAARSVTEDNPVSLAVPEEPEVREPGFKTAEDRAAEIPRAIFRAPVEPVPV